MVTSIARQSVILKCLRKKSVMLGNYEFYYAAGLLNNLYQIGCTKDMKPLELFEYISPKLAMLTPDNGEEEFLIQMLTTYEPYEDYDEQMVELFEWGENEQNKWQVHT